MGYFKEDDSNKSIDFGAIEPPWDKARTSIYVHIKQHLSDQQLTLSKEGQTLPDDEFVFKDGGLRWVAGGLDGAFGHHGGGGNADETAKRLLRSFKKILKSGDSRSVAKFYKPLVEEKTLNFIDPFLRRLADDGLVHDPSLYALAKWILKNSPDREAVKAAIAILGICATNDDCDIFSDVGKHEEFTLFAAVALTHSADNSEEALWDLGKAVDGWGRVHIIERLAKTENPAIHDWMLREGYKNSVMYEYTAHICATTGNLLAALSQPEPDVQLLACACEIISHMNRPGVKLFEYEDGPQATLLLVKHLECAKVTLTQLVHVTSIKELILRMPSGIAEAESWDDVRESILLLCEGIRTRAGWNQEIELGLISEDDVEVWYAARAGDMLGIDMWEHHYARVCQGKPEWHHLMKTQDEDRLMRMVSLAEQTLPLDKLASGVGNSRGLGPEFAAHNALGYVVSALRDWPGRGLKLVRAGLRSSSVSNRHGALMTLQSWGREFWEADLQCELEQLLAKEPNERTRSLIGDIIAGQGKADCP